MCPTYLVAKYSSGNLNKATGGAVKFMMLLANMVGPPFNFFVLLFP